MTDDGWTDLCFKVRPLALEVISFFFFVGLNIPHSLT